MRKREVDCGQNTDHEQDPYQETPQRIERISPCADHIVRKEDTLVFKHQLAHRSLMFIRLVLSLFEAFFTLLKQSLAYLHALLIIVRPLFGSLDTIMKDVLSLPLAFDDRLIQLNDIGVSLSKRLFLLSLTSDRCMVVRVFPGPLHLCNTIDDLIPECILEYLHIIRADRLAGLLIAQKTDSLAPRPVAYGRKEHWVRITTLSFDSLKRACISMLEIPSQHGKLVLHKTIPFEDGCFKLLPCLSIRLCNGPGPIKGIRDKGVRHRRAFLSSFHHPAPRGVP